MRHASTSSGESCTRILRAVTSGGMCLAMAAYTPTQHISTAGSGAPSGQDLAPPGGEPEVEMEADEGPGEAAGAGEGEGAAAAAADASMEGTAFVMARTQASMLGSTASMIVSLSSRWKILLSTSRPCEGGGAMKAGAGGTAVCVREQ